MAWMRAAGKAADTMPLVLWALVASYAARPGCALARPGERCLDYRLPAPGRRCHAERRASGARAQLGQYSDMMVLAHILSATGWCEQGA